MQIRLENLKKTYVSKDGAGIAAADGINLQIPKTRFSES